MDSFIDEAVEQFAHDHTKPESELFHSPARRNLSRHELPADAGGPHRRPVSQDACAADRRAANSGDRDVHRL